VADGIRKGNSRRLMLASLAAGRVTNDASRHYTAAHAINKSACHYHIIVDLQIGSVCVRLCTRDAEEFVVAFIQPQIRETRLFDCCGVIARESFHCICECWWIAKGQQQRQERQVEHAKADKDLFFPQGYDANHPDIDLMRLRNYTIGASLTEEELLGSGNAGLERVSELLGSLKPFVSWRTFLFSATTLPVPHLRPHRTMEGDLAL